MDFAAGDLSSTLHFTHEQLEASQNKCLEAQKNLILGCGRTSSCVERQSWMVLQNEMNTHPYLLCKKRHFSKSQSCELLGF